MRTTLTIDADVLGAARDLASQRGVTIGQVISELARRSLTSSSSSETATSFFGFTPLPHRDAVVSNELVNAIRDEEGL